MALKRITCPSCGGSKFEHDEDGNLICSFCGVLHASPREEIVCPTCGTKNPADASWCQSCGATLGKQCPVCGHENPPGYTHCQRCGAVLDTLEAITTRNYESQHASTVRAARMVEAKQDDAEYMQAQRQQLEEEERERRERLLAQRLEAQRRQKQTMAIVLAAGVVLVIGTLVVVLLTVAR
jgi:ribosomal protein L40E